MVVQAGAPYSHGDEGVFAVDSGLPGNKSMRFFMINDPAFAPQLDMYALTAITDAGFRYFPDTHRYRTILTARMIAINRTTYRRQPTRPPHAHLICVLQK